MHWIELGIVVLGANNTPSPKEQRTKQGNERGNKYNRQNNALLRKVLGLRDLEEKDRQRDYLEGKSAKGGM